MAVLLCLMQFRALNRKVKLSGVRPMFILYPEFALQTRWTALVLLMIERSSPSKSAWARTPWRCSCQLAKKTLSPVWLTFDRTSDYL
jgi:hypothetical protein